MAKIGRNQPCWCRSGIKYKKCHLERDKQKPITRQDAENSIKSLNSKKACSVPAPFKKDCTSKIIKAHTISKGASLKAISDKSHVMGLKPNLSGLISSGGVLELTRIGINQASTITGFCSKHDNELFLPIEDEKFSATKEQLFLLAYRPLVRELYAKESQPKVAELFKQSDKGRDIFSQIETQKIAGAYAQGIDLALRDLNYVKDKLDNMLIMDNYDELQHHIFELSEAPSIVSSASIAPETGFDGSIIQSLGVDVAMPSYIIFNLVSFDGKGFFVISWLKEHATLVDIFVNTLTNHNLERQGDLIVGFLYSFCENVFASPKWWEQLDEKSKNKMIERTHHGIGWVHDRPDNCLVDDGFEYNAVKVANHYRVN